MTTYNAIRGRTRYPGLIDSKALGYFSPTYVAGCVGWYDASGISGSDGDLISLWPDWSGYARDAVGTTTTRPTLKTNIVNGLPVARYSGNHYVDFGIYNYSAGTYFIVWARTNSANNDAVLLQSGTAYSYLQYGSTWYVSSASNATVAMGAGTFTLKSAIYSGSDIKLYTNGSLSSTIVSTSLMATRYIGSAGFALNGDIAELIMYNTNLSDTDRNRVENYLNGKYSLW